MKQQTITLILLVAVLLTGCTAPVLQPVDLASAEGKPQFAPLVEEIEAQMAQQGIPGLAMVIVKDGETAFSQGFGVRHLETQEPVTPETLFRTASTIKPLTAIGLLRLVDAGLVDLDAPITAYLPELIAGDAITVRQLLSHTAGLPDAIPPDVSLEAYLETVEAEAAIFAPGETISYSATGIILTGLIIERVSGQPYPEYMAEQVFTSLGMARTTFDLAEAITYPVAAGYAPATGALDREVAVVRPMTFSLAGNPTGAGSSFTSAADLTQLVYFLLNNGMVDGEQVLPTELVQTMLTPVRYFEPVAIGYGLGTEVYAIDGVAVVGHGGNNPGYTLDVVTVPALDLGIVLTTNKGGVFREPLIRAAIELYADLEAETVAAPAYSAAELAEYVGFYAYPGELNVANATDAIDVQVNVTGTGLNVQLAGIPTTVPAVVTAPDTFQVDLMGNTLNFYFVRDEKGEIFGVFAGLRTFRRVEP